MKPTMQVQAGDTVRRGQTLFADKNLAGVVYTAPAAGTVSAVNRGDRRALLKDVTPRIDAATLLATLQAKLGTAIAAT